MCCGNDDMLNVCFPVGINILYEGMLTVEKIVYVETNMLEHSSDELCYGLKLLKMYFQFTIWTGA